MNYLLDTHTFLWFLHDHPRLSAKAKTAIESINNSIYLSSAVVWEISIKLSIGKIRLKKRLDEFISNCLLEFNFIPYPITIPHAIRLSGLKNIHKDPFDRILIAQSLESNFPLITSDTKIKKYKIKTLW